MKVTLLNSKRLLLEFPSKREMNLATFRITEFKEGPEMLVGRQFDFENFLEAYLDKDGNLIPDGYFNYWEGHNYSKDQLNQFLYLHGFLTEREKRIVEASKQIDNDGYIILMEEGDKITLRHELAHGLYFDSSEYRALADKIVCTIDITTRNKYKDNLLKMNYNESVIMDEAQAYLVAFDSEEWAEICPDIEESLIKEQVDKLNDLFDRYNKV